MEKIKITANDGYVLHSVWMVPVGQFKGTVVINAATGVKKEYYQKFALYLVQCGYRVLTYDYRGIGASAPASLKNFKAQMHEWGTLDMNAVLDYLVQREQVEDITWIGHSIGAQLMGLLNNRHCIGRVIAVSASIGYWNYFPFPYNIFTLSLWLFVGPPLTILKGYAPLKRMGWGESLPYGVYFEWRKWCLNRMHFLPFLLRHTGQPVFADFKAPITAIYASDDYIANRKTVQCLLNFYPQAPQAQIEISPREVGAKKIGHTGIFSSRFQHTIWPTILTQIEAG
jgi:predicted alpha/beta hydrolase